MQTLEPNVPTVFASLKGDRILLRRERAAEVSPGGIIIPENAQTPIYKGVVVQVGTGKKNNDGSRTPIEFEVGQWVLFSKFSYSEITVDGETFVLVGEDAIVGVL